jgi:uncharacterized repeat protein (TIGR03803 family)
MNKIVKLFLSCFIFLFISISLYSCTIGSTPTLNSNYSESVLYSFQNNNLDGNFPNANITVGNDGNFYTTTQYGGQFTNGAVIKITPNQIESVLYSFKNTNDGINPLSGLIQLPDSNFYGTTNFGGTYNNGTIYSVSPQGIESVLYSFESGNDGANPISGLVLANDGWLYGTTYFGGSQNGGVIYKYKNNIESVVYSFNINQDGGNPSAGLIQASNGNLYGTTYYGGINGKGTIYKYDLNNSQFNVLYNFNGESDGANPIANLFQANDGKLYGTTFKGGYEAAGIIFRINLDGANFKTLYKFKGYLNNNNDAAGPMGAFVQSNNGYLYSTTYSSTNNYGTIFKIKPDGSNYSVLYWFQNSPDGANPYTGLTLYNNNFYGTTYFGGNVGSGTIFCWCK